MTGKLSFRTIGMGGVSFLIATSLSCVVSQSRADGVDAKTKTPAPASAKKSEAGKSAEISLPAFRAVDNAEVANLKKLSERYGSAPSLSMKVNKTLTMGVLGVEKKSSGQLWISSGKLRMELQGAERTLLVVNKTDFFAVTFPDTTEFKTAVPSVVRGKTQSTKAKSQALTSLVAPAGFLKVFKPTGVNVLPSGEKTYFLQPIKDHDDFKRAQVKVSADGKQINEFRFWDATDNETTMEFSDVAFGGKVDQKIFDYKPPANADVMNL
ncbi:MAG: outer membrane lipoprotein carrier protein LolA [Bdellovibrionota bacterium]